ALATQRLTIPQVRRLADLAEQVRAHLISKPKQIKRVTTILRQKLQELADEWDRWLIDNRGGDSWDLARVKKRRVEFEARRDELIAAAELTTLPEVLVVDPPWQYDLAETDSRQIENQYPTMTIEEICAKVPKTAENAVLYLWATAPKLEEAL